MSDMEINVACAKAMGWKVASKPASQFVAYPVSPSAVVSGNDKGGDWVWDPLTNDLQALMMLKRFELDVEAPRAGVNPDWEVYRYDDLGPANCHSHPSLNRAICECVAKLQTQRVNEREV